MPLAHAEAALQICSDVCGKWSYDVFLVTELRAVSAWCLAVGSLGTMYGSTPNELRRLGMSVLVTAACTRSHNRFGRTSCGFHRRKGPTR